MTYNFLKRLKFLIIIFCVLGMARAQSEQQLSHIFSTVVQLEDITTKRGVEQMSTGVVVHRDGYILTTASSQATDQQGNRQFRVYTSAADSSPTKWRYIAVLDRYLPNNLQLLKIVGYVDGNALQAGESFQAMEIASASTISQGSALSLWAFPAGIAQRLQRANGQVTATQSNQQFSYVLSSVGLEPGYRGGLATTSFNPNPNVLPQLALIALANNSNQGSQFLQLGQDLRGYLASSLNNSVANNFGANNFGANGSFASPQAVAASGTAVGASSNFRQESTIPFEDSFATSPASTVSFNQPATGQMNRWNDPLGFLRENPNATLNSPFVNNAIAPANSGAIPTLAPTNSTSVAPNGQSNIVVHASGGQAVQDSLTAFAPQNPAQNSVAQADVQLSPYSQAGIVTGQADAIISSIAGRPQAGHVAQHEVAGFLRQAARGGNVDLRAGIYHIGDGIEINQDIHLRGAGKNQTFIVARSGFHVLKFSGQGNFSAEGISFVYEGSGDANGLHMLSGHVSLNNVRSTNTQTQVNAGFVNRNLEGSGLLLDLYVQSARIERSEFDFNPAFGIAVRGQVKPLIHQNLIHHNALAGIRFTEQSGGQVEHNIIEENSYFGVDVSAIGRVKLERNSFRRNGSFGVNAIESAQVNFANNNFDANGHGEIRY